MSRLSQYENYSPGLYGLPHMGEVIASFRKYRGWETQEAFAIVCGVDKQTVGYWESQRYLTDMDRRIFLCKVLKITPPTLLGLTWHSIIEDKQTVEYAKMLESMESLLKENSYALYEDILAFAHDTSGKGVSPESAYRFYKHQRELEALVAAAPEVEKDSWSDLLSRFYQHSTFIAQHRKEDVLALKYATKALDIATSLQDKELLGSALYRRARVYMIQNNADKAKKDISAALNYAEGARGPLKGSVYLLAAEVYSLYAEGDETLKTKCRKWQDKALSLLYKGKVEDDGSFLLFDLYAVHHERAKTQTRFALFHTTDGELVDRIMDHRHVSAKVSLIKDAQNTLATARSQFGLGTPKKEMNITITEARLRLVEGEFEESSRTAKQALHFARTAHSQRGIDEVRKIYVMLLKLAPQNPYVRNLGVELGVY